MAGVDEAVAAGVLTAVSAVEGAVDAELQRLENLDEEGLSRLREQRLQQLKRDAKQQEEWKASGHGVFSEIAEEKEFFDVCKKSSKVVCHFCRDSTWRCKIVDKHLHLLAPRHLETRFVKLSVERAPFLCERLKINVLPTIGLVVDGKTKEFIKGFDELGGTDEFPTELLEWRLGCGGAIDYSGNLLEPPRQASRKQVAFHSKKAIRDSALDSSDSD
jgi:hypothetical protein